MYKKVLAGAAALVMIFGCAVSPAAGTLSDSFISVSAATSKEYGEFYYQVVHGGKEVQITGLIDTELTEIIIPDEIDGIPVTEIGENAFKYCTNLTEVVTPKSLKSIGDYAFCYTKIDKIDLPEGFETIGKEAFVGCSELTVITLPASVTSIGEFAFGTYESNKVTGWHWYGIRTGDGNFFIYCYEGTYAEGWVKGVPAQLKLEYEILERPPIPGDVNKDYTVNVTDVSKAAAHVKGVKSLDEDQLARADVNGDGAVNVTDVSLIAAHVKGVKSLS